MKNYILECDSFNLTNLKYWLSKRPKDENIFVLHKKNNTNKFAKINKKLNNVKVITYEDIFNYENEYREEIDYELFSQLYLSDSLSFFLLDRDGILPSYGIGNHNAMVYYMSRVSNIISFIKAKSIDHVYFRCTPHHSIEWLLAKCSEYCKIKVIVSQRHILPWRYSLALGYGKDRELISTDLNNSTDIDKASELSHLKMFIEQNSKDYKHAIPIYERKRFKKYNNKFINPLKQLNEIISKPHYYFEKIKSYNTYAKLSVYLNKSDTYVAFFLHVQPERTTLPEGYGFHNQLLAITELRQILPKHIKIYVKEHPSMYTLPWFLKARNNLFYKMLIELENVYLLKLETDTFEIIDNALAVSTITGTVGLQSYIRKVPVIFFGISSLKANGVHIYNNRNELKDFIEKLIKLEIKVGDVESEIMNALVGSVSGINNEIEIIDYHDFVGFEESAHFKLLSKYIDLNND